MSKYIKLFETTSQYDAYTADTTNFILPNLTLCKDAPSVVYYNPTTPPAPSHEYVEIGGVKWATMNVGATDITDYGLFFQWGDTSGYTADQVGSEEGQKYFDWEDYKYASIETSTSSSGSGGTTTVVMTKYNDSDGKTVLDASDDAVTAAWGGNWRMPTTDEFIALGNASTTAWTSNYEGSGVAGLILTDKTNSSKKLFFPAAGFCGEDCVYNVGDNGCYWSSSLHSSDVQYAYYLYFDAYGANLQTSYERYYGCAVRGVLDES